MELWHDIVLAVIGLGVTGDLILRWCFKSERRKADSKADMAEAEANTKEWELEEARIKQLHETVETLNNLLKTQAERISAQNSALDDKTDRIRAMTDRAMEAEAALNVANATITRLTEERDEERRQKEKYRDWHCQSSICQPGKPDPQGRRPPNPNILGKQFEKE